MSVVVYFKAMIELVGITVLRFKPILRVWSVLLILVNAMCLYFLHTPYGQIALFTMLIGALIMTELYVRLKFTRLLGIGHIFWIPMIILFLVSMPEKHDTYLFYWVTTLIVVNTISLLQDTRDVIGYIYGNRKTTYKW